MTVSGVATEQETPLAPADLYDSLLRHGVTFFTGVPDSLLKGFIAYLGQQADSAKHVIAANEGGAVALAMGHHLATGGLAAVYLQNSGLGNTVNPLTSLADPEVYGIPLLLVIGWRGRPGFSDEPQHRKQGRITPAMLESMEIPYVTLEPGSDTDALVGAMAEAARGGRPAAIVVPPGRLGEFKAAAGAAGAGGAGAAVIGLRREAAIEAILARLPEDAVVVSTTGMASREVFEYRARRGEGHGRDFLTVGGMGHASQIALGIALARPDRPVYCLDGDGAAIMHLGSLAIIGSRAPANYRHIVINNGAHDSVGGQPTAGFEIDLCAAAGSCGYTQTIRADALEAIAPALERLAAVDGPTFLEVRVDRGARADLGRPTTTPLENKLEFMDQLR